MSVETTDVLISGLGPVGAALAVYLGRRGISAVAIDRDTAVYPMPRERDPHVRGITGMAVFMGKIVCTQNEEAAAARDRDMTAKPEAERFSPTPELNGLASGVVPGDPMAGTVFPEPWVRDGGERRRIDDVAGFVPMLISRSAVADDTSQFEAEGGYVASLADGTILDADGAVAALLEGHDAILVRPDRYIFGRGSVASLMASWRHYLATGEATVWAG